MATPPVAQAVRARLDYTESDNFLGGSRFFLTYTGSAPTGANLNTLAGDIEAAWVSHLAPLVNEDFTLSEIDCLDLSSDTGASGYWSGSEAGSRSGAVIPANCCTNIEFDIARRYRGGKPRMYLPAGVQGDLEDVGHWSGSFITAVNSGIGAFFSELEGLSIGAMGTLAHANISFYHGVNTSSPPWRGPGYKYPPKYRDTVLIDPVASYATKGVVGSQRRRRTATTY
jgi:hypothetical protein